MALDLMTDHIEYGTVRSEEEIKENSIRKRIIKAYLYGLTITEDFQEISHCGKKGFMRNPSCPSVHQMIPLLFFSSSSIQPLRSVFLYCAFAHCVHEGTAKKG